MNDETKKPAGDDGDDDVEEFVVVETDAAGKPVQSTQTADDGDDADDDQTGDDADDDDERLGHAEGEEEEHANRNETPEEKRERRRRENKAKRIRNRIAAEAKDRLIAQLSNAVLDLQEKIGSLEGRTVRYDVNVLQNQLAMIQQQQAEAKATHAALLEAKDYNGVAEVTEIQQALRDQFRTVSQKLERARRQVQQGGGRDEAQDGHDDPQQGARRPQQKQPVSDPEIVARARVWAEDNPWFDPTSSAAEARIVRQIDAQIAAEGFNPKSDRYWNELTKRVSKRFPQHFKTAQNGRENRTDERPTRNKTDDGGPRMAPATQRGSKRPLGKNEVYITPDRKAAMIAAGAWDDPVKRSRMLKSYAEYDRAQREQG